MINKEHKINGKTDTAAKPYKVNGREDRVYERSSQLNDHEAKKKGTIFEVSLSVSFSPKSILIRSVSSMSSALVFLAPAFVISLH